MHFCLFGWSHRIELSIHGFNSLNYLQCPRHLFEESIHQKTFSIISYQIGLQKPVVFCQNYEFSADFHQ